MPVAGAPSHIDLSIADPDRSIPFYAAFFDALGFRRWRVDLPDCQGEKPQRGCWALRYPSGAWFGIEVRPAAPESRDRPIDRYAPGLHHL